MAAGVEPNNPVPVLVAGLAPNKPPVPAVLVEPPNNPPVPCPVDDAVLVPVLPNNPPDGAGAAVLVLGAAPKENPAILRMYLFDPYVMSTVTLSNALPEVAR